MSPHCLDHDVAGSAGSSSTTSLIDGRTGVPVFDVHAVAVSCMGMALGGCAFEDGAIGDRAGADEGLAKLSMIMAGTSSGHKRDNKKVMQTK